MPSCTIKWCRKSSKTSNYKKDGITFHRYPKELNIKEKWIIATQRNNWLPSTHSKICSRHFEEDCFKSMKNRRRLLSSAVPTLFLPIMMNTLGSNSSRPSTSSNQPITSENLPTSPILIPENPSNSQIKKRLSRRITELSDKVVQKNRQIKNLRQNTCYLRKKLVILKSLLKDVEKKI